MKMTEIRLPEQLYRTILTDLNRPHHVALERGGFVFGKLVDEHGPKPLILLYRYSPIADDDYLEDSYYAACFKGDAIRKAMQELRDRRNTGECVFHVHMHEHSGYPGFSRPDINGLPPIIPSFTRVGADGAHGLLLLSQDRGTAIIWLPGNNGPVQADQITVVGKPLEIWGNAWQRR